MGRLIRQVSRIDIQKRHWDLMAADCQASLPAEACGIVAGMRNRSLEVFSVENSLHSPVRYRMDPHRQLEIFNLLEDRGWDLMAIYHSHPTGPETPSPTDVSEAYYPDAVYLIWSLQGQSWGCRAFLIQDGEVEEVPLHVTDQADRTG